LLKFILRTLKASYVPNLKKSSYLIDYYFLIRFTIFDKSKEFLTEQNVIFAL